MLDECLDYFKDRYKDEIDTFNHLENKAAKLLTFLSIIIGALGTTAGFKSGALFHLEPHLPWTWAKLAIFIFSILFSSFSWWHALLALKIGDCPVLPRGQDAADFICFYEDKRNKSKREFEKLSHSKN
ncbi:hypothetical protein [Pseudomonas luteola]|uniref:hypothetical protein n=1 Tax=Pseudomonas luteola TaxID=47886 RepID=UPI0012A81E8B|nr:hypothetical protein [Pseudomonas luteola]QEU31449.1 hypothetical protein FOB45_27150 [Pseudomonas luteola]